MNNYVSVTVVSVLDHPCNYTPRTAVFSSGDAAENFKNSVEALLESKGQSEYYHVSIDSGTVDSESYLEMLEMDFDNEFTEEEYEDLEMIDHEC